MQTFQQRIADAIKASGDLNSPVDIRSYSGRGMYGRECVAITGSFDDCQRVLSTAASEAVDSLFSVAIDSESEEDMRAAYNERDQVLDFIQNLPRFSWDSMGRDVVMYWPRIEWVDEQE